MGGRIHLGVKDAVGLAADDDGSGAAEAARRGGARIGGAGWVGDEEAGLFRGEVEDVDAAGSGVEHLLVVRGVGVDVEVEAAGVGLGGDAPDSVAGIFIDPGSGRKLLGREHESEEGGCGCEG